MKRRYLFNLIRVSISVLAIAFLLITLQGETESAGGLAGIFTSLKETVNPRLFTLAFLGFLLAATTLAVRLRIVFSAQGINLRLPEVVSLTFIGYLFNNFLPTAIGGDVAKIYYAGKRTGRRLESATAVIMDRFVGAFSLFLIASCAFIFARGIVPQLNLFPIIPAILLFLIAVLFFVFHRKTEEWCKRVARRLKSFHIGAGVVKFYDIIDSYKNKKKNLLGAFFISLVLQSLAILVNFTLAKSLGLALPLSACFLIIPLVGVISMLPSLGGLGVRESGYVFLFTSLGTLNSPDAFAISILFLLILLGVSMIGGVIYLADPQYRFPLEV